MDLRLCKNHSERRSILEKETGVSLSTIGEIYTDDPSIVHCENLIGSISLPLGVAGPLRIHGEQLQDTVYLPLATTEGALVASVNRGCKAILASGGVQVQIQNIGATRGPVFRTHGIQEGKKLMQWIETHFTLLKQEAKTTSSHLDLLKVHMQMNGTEVYVRFDFDTEEAMGMNMATIATDKIVKIIEKECNVCCIAVAGNYDIDKKPAWLNMISGRGKRGWAEILMSRDNVESILKTTPEKIEEIVRVKCWGGSMMAGSLGFNAHFANIVAAFYAATGQDLAHVVEGSHGVTSARLLPDGDLYFSIMMPALMIGMVGGGTKLKTQREAQSLTKAKTAIELAEVLVGGVLAGELSLIASISAQSLANVHKSLGR